MPKASKKEGKKRDSALARWAFTWWESSETQREALIEWLKMHTKRWVFQLEKGEESGNEHFQGRFSLKERMRLSQVVKLLKFLNAIKPVHLSEEHCEEGSNFYAMKAETRIAGPWSDKMQMAHVPTDWAGIEGEQWWEDVNDMVENQGLRKVTLVYDPVGNTGKTAYVKVAVQNQAVVIPATMDTVDKMMGCAYAQLSNGIYHEQRAFVIFDLKRSTKKTMAFWTNLCQMIECVKDGHVYDWRYTYRQAWINPPEVLVFTNHLPPPGALSADRWTAYQPGVGVIDINSQAANDDHSSAAAGPPLRGAEDF